MREEIENLIKESIEVKQKSLGLSGLIEEAAKKIIEAYESGNKLILFGSGGSAADAQHIATELVSRFKLERKAWPALALTTNTSTLTAIGNDYGFEPTFERQVEAFAKKGDVVIAISTSGNSVAGVRAIKKAKDIDCFVIGFTGESGGEFREFVDLLINVPSRNTPRIQEAHIMVGHIICELVEKELSKNS